MASDSQRSLWFSKQTAYSLKLKFRPEDSVIGDEGPALDTALEGMLPSEQKTHTHKLSVNTCFPPLVQTVDVLKSPSMTQLIIPLLSTPEPSLHSASQEPCYLLLYMRHGEGHKVNTNERASWHNNRKASSARLFISLPWGTLCKLLLYVLGFIN